MATGRAPVGGGEQPPRCGHPGPRGPVGRDERVPGTRPVPPSPAGRGAPRLAARTGTDTPPCPRTAGSSPTSGPARAAGRDSHGVPRHRGNRSGSKIVHRPDPVGVLSGQASASSPPWRGSRCAAPRGHGARGQRCRTPRGPWHGRRFPPWTRGLPQVPAPARSSDSGLGRCRRPAVRGPAVERAFDRGGARGPRAARKTPRRGRTAFRAAHWSRWARFLGPRRERGGFHRERRAADTGPPCQGLGTRGRRWPPKAARRPPTAATAASAAAWLSGRAPAAHTGVPRPARSAPHRGGAPHGPGLCGRPRKTARPVALPSPDPQGRGNVLLHGRLERLPPAAARHLGHTRRTLSAAPPDSGNVSGHGT